MKTPGGKTALDIAKDNQSKAAALQLELPSKSPITRPKKSEQGAVGGPDKSAAALMEAK